MYLRTAAFDVIHVKIRTLAVAGFSGYYPRPEAQRAADDVSVLGAPCAVDRPEVITNHTPGASISSQLHVAFITRRAADQSVFVSSYRSDRARADSRDTPERKVRVTVLVANAGAILFHHRNLPALRIVVVPQAASTATLAASADCVRHQSLTVGVVQTRLGQTGWPPALGVRDLSEVVPTLATVVTAAHGLRQHSGAVCVVAARLSQHYLWYEIDSGLDGVQVLLQLLLPLLLLLLLLLDGRVGPTGETALRRLDGVQVLLQLLENLVDAEGESSLRRVDGVQVLLQLLLPLFLLLLLLLENRVDSTGQSALRRLDGVQLFLRLLLLQEHPTGQIGLRRLDGVQLLLGSCLRLLLLLLRIVKELQTSGYRRHTPLYAGELVDHLDQHLGYVGWTDGPRHLGHHGPPEHGQHGPVELRPRHGLRGCLTCRSQ